MNRVPRDIGELIGSVAARRPDAEAIVAHSGRLSYAELDAAANRAARAWLELGVAPGDRVAACLPNDLEIIAAFHGAMRVGAIWLGVGEALAPPEKAYLLRDSGAAIVLCDPATASQLATQAAEIPQPLTTVAGGARPGGGEPTEWAQRLAAERPDPIDVVVDPLAPAAIAYTSGTTGFPKGALHSQRNLILPGAYLVASRGYDDRLRKADCFALTLLNMLVLTTLLTAQAEGCAVIMDSLRSEAIVDWIRRERATVWNGPPPVLYTMARDERITSEDLASLQEVWSGGADLPETIRTAFQTKFAASVRGTYGLTEAPTMVAIEPIGAPHEHGSSGRPMPHLEVTIRDEADRVLATGEVGEICVGPRDPGEIPARMYEDFGVTADPAEEMVPYATMLSYWERPEQTRTALRGGVLHTGDAGALDERGNLSVTDRLTLVLNRGGANVYPAEVERVVVGWEDVEACAVLGVPDDRLGQRVGMLVQFKDGAEGSIDQLLAYCRTQLAPYKIPEFVAGVDSFPRNAMGKIDRRALAEIGAARLTARQPAPTQPQ